MISLADIDSARAHAVRQAKHPNRGSGKTIERLLTLLSLVQLRNVRKTYLFVAENNYARDELRHMFYMWCIEYGVIHANDRYGKDDIHVSFPPQKLNWFQSLIASFKKPKPTYYISFKFCSPTYAIKRGEYYDITIVDVSPDTYINNLENIEKLMKA